MENRHPIDIFMIRIRGLLFIVALLCLPAFLLSYAWMLKSLMTEASGWISAAVILSHFTVWVGIASLVDMRQEKARQ